MHKKVVAGNWKMHETKAQAEALLMSIREGVEGNIPVDVLIFPPFVHLSLTQTLLANCSLKWGAQNLYLGPQGAFTGEISGPMLVDYGCHSVLVGHSERRSLFNETNEFVAAKFHAALQSGLSPLLCVGESLEQREANQTEAIIHQQLNAVIKVVGIHAFKNSLIAYEPVWAIGTGQTASPEQAESIHQFIRQQFAEESLEVAETVRILYGGSVKVDNASGLFAQPNIDGALIGGASLQAGSFIELIKLAARSSRLQYRL